MVEYFGWCFGDERGEERREEGAGLVKIKRQT